MYTFKSALIGLSVSWVICSISVRRTGWLDRVIEYQKKIFIDDLMKQPVKITARIEKAPPAYVDSKDWDYDSVIRLLTLIRDSEGAAPVRRAFRRAIKTNRRFLSFSETFKAFPSLIKEHPYDFHYTDYDADSGDIYADVPPEGTLEMNDVIVVSNPVEAKLPSASISVNLLKEILENRAAAGRVMPTAVIDVSWPVTAKKSTLAKEASKNSESASTTALAEETTTASPAAETVPANDNETAVNATSTNDTKTS